MPAKRIRTVQQISAGGVVYRPATSDRPTEVAIVRVAPTGRWQLPKGVVDSGESPEVTAVREVREEAGIDSQLIAPLDVIEYWYVGTNSGGERVRFHKFVHFFLLEYQGGDVALHDHEVEESRWVALREAEGMLAFASERKAMAQARRLVEGRPQSGDVPP